MVEGDEYISNIPKSGQGCRQPKVNLPIDFKVPGALLQFRAIAPHFQSRGRMKSTWYSLVGGGAQPLQASLKALSSL